MNTLRLSSFTVSGISLTLNSHRRVMESSTTFLLSYHLSTYRPRQLRDYPALTVNTLRIV